MNHRLAFIAKLSSLAVVAAVLSSAIGAAYDVKPAYADKAGICGTPGQQGTSNITGIVNSYYPGAATATAGATTISLGAIRDVTEPAIAAGNLVLVIQMQGEDMNATNTNNYGNGTGDGGTAVNTVIYPGGEPNYAGGNLATNFQAGQYEYVRAVSLVGTTLTIATGLVNTYVFSDPATSADQGRRRFQAVRVPQYINATLGGTVSAPRWNGSTGGIVALDIANQLNWNGNTIDVTGLGFRGGGARQLTGTTGFNWWDFRTIAGTGNNVAGANGAKGEGTAGTPRYVNDNGTLLDAGAGAEGYPNGSNGRGAGGDGGGGSTDGNPSANDQNSGGGGAGNGGYGGMGGWSWNSAIISGGYGGAPYNPSASGPSQALRLSMGGGGGAGTTNNGTGAPLGFASSGVAGGGMALVRSGTITGSGTINANGLSAPARGDANVVLNDGGGGGGAGGTVLVIANNGSGGVGTLTVNTNGGRGGDDWPDQDPGTSGVGSGNNHHGPGGGGGGGHVFVSGAITSSVLGGAAGISTTDNSNFGATGGGPGEVVTVHPTDTPPIVAGADCVDLSITKTDGVTTLPTGTTTTYSIVVTNPGPSSADGAIFTDPAVAGLTVTSVTCGSPTGGAVCPTGAGISISLMQGAGIVIPTLPGGASPGSSVTFTVVALVTASAGGTVTNVATVAPPPGPPAMNEMNNADNTASDSDTVIAADLHLAKTDGVTQVVAGGTTPYTLTVSNTGAAATSGTITIVDVLPAGMSVPDGAVTLTGGQAANWICTAASNVITCTSSTPIAATSGTSVFSFTVNVSLNAVGPLVNKAQVGGDGDPLAPTPTPVTAGACTGTDTPTKGCAMDSDTVIAADLGISKTDGSATYTPGAGITYTIVVTNAGPSDATGASVTDTVPAVITGTTIGCVATGTANCGTNGSLGNSLSYTGVNIAAGAGNYLTITVSGTVSPSAIGNLVNAATVTAGAQTDPNSTNNTATDTDTPNAQADLTVIKTDDVNGATTLGSSFTWTLTVNNANATAAFSNGNVILHDDLPSGPTYGTANEANVGGVSGTISCSITSHILECTANGPVSLAAGGSFTVSFLVTPAAAGTLNNPGTAVCSVDPGNAVNESNEENNTCSNSVTVSVVTGIQKTLTGTNQTFTTGSNVAIGEILTYTVVVNLEAGTYNSAQLVDTMDLGLAFMDCTSITGLGTTPTDFSTACGGPTFNLALSTDPAYHSVATFDLGDLTAASSGGSITFVYRAVVLDSSGNITGKTLSNHAVFHWIDPQEQPQTVAANPTTVTIVEPRSTITKVGDVQFIGVGSIVNFTMTIQNLGNTDAYDVHLTDPIPSQFDLIGSIDCSTTAGSTRDPDFGPLNVAGVITAYWASAQPNPTAFAPGDVGVCKFQLQANATLQPGQQVTNIAYVEWSSLPGDFRQPQIPNDPFSTERFYDPNDPAINNYIANSNTPFNPLGGGGGGGCKNCFRIPQAGFAPGVLTDLSGVPWVAYDDSMGVSLRIPKIESQHGDRRRAAGERCLAGRLADRRWRLAAGNSIPRFQRE